MFSKNIGLNHGNTTPHTLCLLTLKTLHGLKQSRWCWFQWLVQIMINLLGFTQCEVNQAVFFKHESNGNLMVVVMHIDDCTIAR